MSELNSVLPPNRTAVERALEATVKGTVPDVTVVGDLTSPERCPVELLGWLAWAYSVDVWRSSWSEERKRKTVAASLQIHRLKGTVGAVRRALSTLDFRAEITEWFEEGGDPHTFAIDVFGEDVFAAGLDLDPELFDLVNDLIENVKPVRTQYALRVGESHSVQVNVRTGMRDQRLWCRTAIPALPQFTHAPLAVVQSGQRARQVSCQTHIFDLGEELQA